MSDDAADPFASMTLAQLEALAERFGSAVRIIHEAKSLLGGGIASSTQDTVAPAPDDASTHRARQFQPPEQAPNRHPVLSAAEVNQRNALLGRGRGLSDEDMEALKR